ncbi:DNA-binding HxlR family transcriptional regulator [Xanthomonas sacchari]|uniref:winged helix-turn-helix transcriptional regulator n=1 Tax=unclassified Xanthomonas TaxID=2643310 RepID=UPI001371F144|nr:DNA-binding HxlR family transcriptional regulator [Xanthomonas sp. F10]MXV31531.1 transcriptional regulator [Xanthomonas sp. LMG 8989]
MKPSHIDGAPNCTNFTRELLSRVGDKWSILIVAHLASEPMRFNTLKRTIGQVSQRMLTLTLKSLEKDGLVSRTMYPTIPPRVEYALTPLGQTLMQPVMSLIHWSHAHQDEVEASRRAHETGLDATDEEAKRAP